jgi:pimeloyl-ACP methyl ester carboxylesterase
MPLIVHESGTPTAPTIVFLHAIATSEWMWRKQVNQLQDFHCLVPDLPGHGQSYAERWNSLEDTAAQIAQIIRSRATHGRAHLVGLSLGSYVVAQLIASEAEVVDHAIMSGVTTLPLPGAGMMGIMGYLMAPLIKTDLMVRANAKMLRVPPENYDEYRQNVKLMSRQGFLGASAAAGGFRMPPAYASVAVPTLVVAGAREHNLMRQSMAQLVATMPHVEARIVPNVGHGWNGEAPELFSRMIRAWISDAPLPDELEPFEAPGVAQPG